MIKSGTKYIRIAETLVFAFFLFLPIEAYSQEESISKVDYSGVKPDLSPSVRQTEKLLPHAIPLRDKNMIFLDSFKEKASKSMLTRKLFEMVVVSPDLNGRHNMEGQSESYYLAYSGSRIRKINITRLPVFGSDINNPASYKGYRGQNFLNKTHINTLEVVVRNNLLFKTGDTISPILLSDNERLLRDLSFIDDARIRVIPVSPDEVDIQVITKDVYSLGGDYSPSGGLTSGSISLFDNNILGIGHELGFEIPFDKDKPDSPGFGVHYLADNIAKSFINFKVSYYGGLGEKFYGIDVNRKFVSSETKYAGGIAVQHVYRFEDLDTMLIPEPLRFNLQDFWLGRSFLLDPATVSRFIISARYTNNNILSRPFILPDSYHPLQKYRMYLGSFAFSRQKYFKTNLVYSYGRTEDIPYGSLLKVTIGREINEFKIRNYAGSELSFGKSFKDFGYLHSSAGIGSFINNGKTEQGILYLRARYFSNLMPLGRNMIRNFVRFDLTRGFDRNFDEYLNHYSDNGFSGFRNDSIQGRQRITIGLETVLFSPLKMYGFRFAFFGFADISSLSAANQVVTNGTSLSGIGLGLRVRNDNLIFNTFQIRIGFFPNTPQYSRINYVIVSGEQPLRMEDFGTGAPSPIPYQ